MASNYTGNPTVTRAPSGPPAVNTPVIVSIPAGTDPSTIESITQSMQVCPDNLTFILQILGGTRSSSGLVVDATGGVSETASPGNIQATGTVLATTKTVAGRLEVNTSPTINTNVGLGHVAFAGSGVSVAAQAVGAGTGCSATITGSDTRGFISLTTGTSPQPNATLALITFANPRTGYFGGPFTLLTPSTGGTVSAASCQVSAGLNGTYPNIKVALQSGPSALAASTTYQWNYLILE